MISPKSVVLGNYKLTAVESGVYSAFWVTFFLWGMWDFIFVRRVKLEPPIVAFLFFGSVNSLGVWLVSRFSHLAGMGISSFGWAIVIGVTVTVIQRVVWGSVVVRRRSAM